MITRLPLTECVEWRIAWFPLHISRTLPPEKRHAAEILLGVALGKDVLLLVRSSKGRILKPGLTGEALDEAYRQMFEWSAEMAKRVEGIPEGEIDEVIDEAVDFVGHNR